ncbi:MAG: Dethiobiotin synthase [Bacteroidota bacterium]|jgi:dethiobiotin synthetase
MPKQFIIAGIGTEIGKTVCSAIITKALQADYWKPVQAGNLTDGDAYWVQQWVPGTQVFPSTYALNHPLSPHTAAELDGVSIEIGAFYLPETTNNLVIELAGGIMVPLNNEQTNLDLIQHLGLPVILVSKNYLGSINHTLLTYEILKSRNISMAGIIFNGPTNTSGEAFIIKHTGLPVMLRVNEESEINSSIINQYAESFSC